LSASGVIYPPMEDLSAFGVIEPFPATIMRRLKQKRYFDNSYKLA